MNTMKPRLRGDLVKVAAVGVQSSLFNPHSEDCAFSICVCLRVVKVIILIALFCNR